MVSEEIVSRLKEFDPEPQLEIVKRNLPFIHKMVMLSDGKNNYPENPTTYIVNVHKVCDKIPEKMTEEIFAVMVAARAVRRRLQSSNKQLKPFLTEEADATFRDLTANLRVSTWDQKEFDAEIVARIIGQLYIRRKTTNQKIKEILAMDAPGIIERLGIEFVLESIRRSPLTPIDLDLHLYPSTPIIL
jgi:hypothetical protein